MIAQRFIPQNFFPLWIEKPAIGKTEPNDFEDRTASIQFLQFLRFVIDKFLIDFARKICVKNKHYGIFHFI